MSRGNLESLQKLPTRELKEMCRDANMKVSGTKSQLLMRLCGMEKEKPKTSTRMSVKAVNKWLEKQGVANIESVSRCLRAGIQKGYIDISGDSPLDNVIGVDSCKFCGDDLKPTIRDLLYQPDYAGGDYEEGGVYATVRCSNKECPGGGSGVYVTRLCCNETDFDSGKFHNHCRDCPGFGKCTGDYRMQHCESCNRHFHSGIMGFPCPCQGRPDDRDGVDDCVLQ
ncbi:uncharacterized protein LOC117104117 [Anneissia japonica]|uniref:uncharacterized protein LOC117104117 n=1 Tax=Anneissia japonica TaxID=1529436 RepID=UPI0014257691|nr:uncharacterized protein LOC117104117 [Anneissia japonica]